MNATETTRIEIDDAIREQPELHAAITRASEYIQEKVVEVSPPSIIRWRYADTDGKLLQLTLVDSPPFQHQLVQHNYWTRWIQDPVNRKLCVLEAWGELLAKRSDARMARIDQLIAKLKAEAADGGEDVN